jgi:hypothetical protein
MNPQGEGLTDAERSEDDLVRIALPMEKGVALEALRLALDVTPLERGVAFVEASHRLFATCVDRWA